MHQAAHHLSRKEYAAAHAHLGTLSDAERDEALQHILRLPRYTFFTHDHTGMSFIPEVKALFDAHAPALERLGHPNLVAQQTMLARLIS